LQYTREYKTVNRHIAIDALFVVVYLADMQTLSTALRAAIRNSGKTQLEIANAIGISNGILSRFMREERSMNLETADKVCAYLALELREVVKRGRK